MTNTIQEKIERLNSRDLSIQEKCSYPCVWDVIKEYGAENIFYVSHSYRSMYHDDYCTFTYYNNVTGEEFTDEWSTAFQAPPYELYEDCITIQEAEEGGLIDKQKILDKNIPALLEKYSSLTPASHLCKLSPDVAAKACLKVAVTSGRKWEGVGYLVGKYSASFRYASTQFPTRDNFGVPSITYAKVYDAKTNEINNVVYSHVQFVDIDNIIADYSNHLVSYLNSLTADDICGIHISIPVEYNFEKFVLNNYTNNIDISNAKDPYEESRQEKADAFKIKKIEDLTRWARQNTQVPEDELPTFVERLYNKKYGRR